MTYVVWTDTPENPYATGEAFATIYFHGRLALCFTDKRCEIGVDSKASMHELNLQVRKRGTPSCTQVPLSLPLKSLNIEVLNPEREGVYVYETPGLAPVNGRYSYIKYGFDMEGDEMHARVVKKLSNVLKPRFYIDNALFYTYKVSLSKFVLRQGRRITKSGSIGLVLAADIYLNEHGTMKFSLDSASSPSLELLYDSGEKYDIAITNSCRSKPTSAPRTDFYEYYDDIIDQDDVKNAERFDVDLIEDKSDGTPLTFGFCKMGDFPFGDPAPCLPVTFGRSSNLD